MKKQVYIVILFQLIFQPYSTTKERGVPDKVGNFSLITSQQPAPLFSFGQNIVDKNDVLLFSRIDAIGGKKRQLNTLFFGVLYGIRNDLSLFTFIPYIPKIQYDNDRSHGLGDIFTQLEYMYLSIPSTESAVTGTILGNITIPTGSINKKFDVRLGLGGLAFFLGTTLSYIKPWWNIWFNGGTLLTTTASDHIKAGNLFLYQTGIECCFAARNDWIFAGMLELFGQYEQKTKIQKVTNNDTGGNTLWFGPTLWASNNRFVFQLGIAAPIAQHLFGQQNKNHYQFAANILYKI